ncbi:MAG: FxLYD domain-containing protein [Deltaproteobacteria bacterium]|jgi:hypothetical protein|nr:FxLYD domain-containing protein [Deltaproteobacteria bacterium]
MKKSAFLGLFFALIALMSCSQTLYVPGDKMPPITADVSQLGPGSLKLEVGVFQWSYTNGSTHIRVSGTVINNTGQTLQSCQLQGTLYDQDGTPIMYGSSYVYPAYLAPGSQGSFEFVGLTRREKGLKYTRLVTVASAQVAR